MAEHGVYCTGNIVVDCLVRPVERLPVWGTTTYVESVSMHLGGNGAAAAYTAALLGVPVKLAGAVGRDPQGEYARTRLEAAGVDLSQLRTLEGLGTAATVGLINQRSDRLFFHELGASVSLTSADVPFGPEVVRGCRYFHFGSIFCLPQLRREARGLLQSARQAGLEVSVDTDWDPEGRWIDDFEPLCELTDYLFLNQEEARMLTGADDPAQIAKFFRERGVKVVVLKRGDQGCAVFGPEEDFEFPAYLVQAVDTTGAGDCFCGGFLAGLCRGGSLREAARLASATAARCVERVGGTDGVVDYEAIQSWMQSMER